MAAIAVIVHGLVHRSHQAMTHELHYAVIAGLPAASAALESETSVTDWSALILTLATAVAGRLDVL